MSRSYGTFTFDRAIGSAHFVRLDFSPVLKHPVKQRALGSVDIQIGFISNLQKYIFHQMVLRIYLKTLNILP